MSTLRATAIGAALMIASLGAAADPPVPASRAQVAALADELRLHPDATADDVYKLLHQGVFGPGHAIADRESAASALDEEIAGLPPATVNEPLCQPLGGPAPMARIHLRTLLAAKEDPAALVDMLVVSSALPAGTAADMDAALEAAVAWLVKGGQWALAGDLQTLAPGLADGGYPAVHHSEAYRNGYRPAYRVVVLELARAKGWCQ
ncbi:MAG TPA: hypothetical protein PKJ99_02365 [Thermoanaerobaculales bacterium]|nr:hypothetical protein [Thermoanaerobaculales bacterium]HPA81284.1 hypothetical protein [Thermoanaerobaculales bacterium]HQL30332.1 hypothetical protein [Thermoanaerobaculales bacterium]HQN95285.1 hypothetical protein [Thermoanaerobaculales bacterium]HQP42316.1 hypothetical protein [Thermoanaerobaculales bacterium]